MCELCTKHGDGKIWYKNARNYAQDLMSDLRRRRYIEQFLETTIGEGIAGLGRLETIFRKKKKLPDRLKRAMESKAREEHFGQIVPFEDVQGIIEGAASIVRMPCACRWAAEKREERCCYAISYSPETWHQGLDMSYFGKVPDEGFESLSPGRALAQIKSLGEAGAVHTIWTMITPFIGAICNCTNKECLGLRTLAMNVVSLAPGEYKAVVNHELCNGCGLCAAACPFQAISGINAAGGRNPTRSVAAPDPQKCLGCGLCRNHCPQEALSLRPI